MPSSDVLPSFSDPAVPRRAFLAQVALQAAALGAAAVRLPAQPRPLSLPEMQVYKDPNCGCCAAWVTHVRGAGFRVAVHDTADMDAVKASFGIPAALHSCHTARLGRWLVEGHVPADLLKRLAGLTLPTTGFIPRGVAVPGMPMGSPGMEGPNPERYDILLFDAAGRTRVYATRG
ncbi:MAG: DUF411 domain-containing protein [Gemmatimonadetes bacterium]|nr:DUF411 domain-containing protein [Gemmatimonadota bacterium]